MTGDQIWRTANPALWPLTDEDLRLVAEMMNEIGFRAPEYAPKPFAAPRGYSAPPGTVKPYHVAIIAAALKLAEAKGAAPVDIRDSYGHKITPSTKGSANASSNEEGRASRTGSTFGSDRRYPGRYA